MLGLLAGEIEEADVRWAAELMGLGPDGFAAIGGDDSRMKALLNLDTADYEACPGSGKTTLLVAKLAILASKWPRRAQGVCVLSHTNAARNEIGHRLSTSSAGVALMRYPHFVGTIHSFVNEFLAAPWLRSRGNAIRTIDTQIALAKRKALLGWNWRRAMDARHLGDNALMYEATDYTGGRKGSLGAHTDLYKAMVEVSRTVSEEGYFCFDEMFVWANDLLDRRPELALDLRCRFPIVFVDEAQDNSEAQSAILHRIFSAGDQPSRRQRFGDSNQAIYAHAGAEGAQTDPFPSAAPISLPRSYRFPQSIADTVKAFGVIPQALVGAGPSASRIACAGKQSALFLFDDASVQQVLPRYGAHLLEVFDESELAVGVFTAVAGVHEMEDDKPIPRAMGHYAPRYDAACARKEAAPATFAQYLAKARFETGVAGNTHMLVNALASALLRLSELSGALHPTYGRKSAHRRLIEAVEATPAYATYLGLVNRMLAARGDFTKAAWNNEARPLVEAVAAQLAGGAPLAEAEQDFLKWPAQVVLEAEGDANASRTDNLFSYPADDPKVRIRLGSIHSVKGETHTATLVLDTYFHSHHLRELKPWLLGERSGGMRERRRAAPVLEGPRLIGRLKLHYVAMTRPSHLLCLAMRRDAFEEAELLTLQGLGWRVIDCCAVAPDKGEQFARPISIPM